MGQRITKLDPRYIIQIAIRFVLGQRNHRTESVPVRQTGRDDNGRSSLDHFRRLEAATAIITKQNRSNTDRILDSHSI